MVGVLQILTVVGLAMIGLRFELGGFYFTGVLVALALFGYQQFVIHDRVPAHCFRAFLNNAWVGFAVLLGIILDYAAA